MIIGIPKEIKKHEYRAAITPVGVETLREAGHKILIQKGAGVGSGIDDAEYESAGAAIAKRRDVFRESELLVKVKEPLPTM